MIDKNFTYAIVGASNNPEKYGYKVLMDLYGAGYKVVPINPKGGEIANLKVYKNLQEYAEKIDVAVFIVPPEIAESILPQVIVKGIKRVWFQPGSESQNSIKYCQENNLECIANACIMIEKSK